MELYYEIVKSGNTTLKVARFRKKNITKKPSGKKETKIPYSKWTKLNRPREAAKRYFSKIGDSNSLEILQALNFIVSNVTRNNSYQIPKGSAISQINNKYRIQGRVGKEVNMYLGMYDTIEEAKLVIDKARSDFRNGKSEREIRENWKESRKVIKSSKKNTRKLEPYYWECPQCSKILKSKNGYKGHLKMHSKNNKKKNTIKKRRIIFKKKLK
jgi:hypothetical protein